MTEKPVETQTRICDQCGRNLPITEFRLRFKSGTERHSSCNDCRNAYNRQKRWKRQHRDLSKAFTELSNTRRAD